MITAVLDHLWQSTLFAGIAGLLTLMLKRNGARVRYALWFAASVKFLVPIAVLTALGARLAPPLRTLTGAGSAAPFLQQFGSAIATPASFAGSRYSGLPIAAHFSFAMLLILLWTLGTVAVCSVWLARWVPILKLCREARPLQIAAPVSVKCSTSPIEPALVGILRPVVLLPEGLIERLSPEELRAVLAHEVAHLRRHDNLTAAMHMLVEAVFWFFPVTWWLGGRLNVERERACDEAVLSRGSEPVVYAESILKVCKFYVHVPIDCAAGVSSADLKRRVEQIMSDSRAHQLDALKMAVIMAAAVLTLALPLGAGILKANAFAADDSVDTTVPPTPAQVAERAYEQARPRTAVPFNPPDFDKYVGYYQLTPIVFFHVTRNGDHYFIQPTLQAQIETFPESPTTFFVKTTPMQISFVSDSKGRTTSLLLHQEGQVARFPKIDDSIARRVEAQMAQHIAANTASPGTEAALRHQIAAMVTGTFDYSGLGPNLAEVARKNGSSIWTKMIKPRGAFQSLAFKGVGEDALDVYDATFANGQIEFRIGALAQDGKVLTLYMRTLP
jgi:beta-lactamase regulating signal transducer with metallopeptidase domain